MTQVDDALLRQMVKTIVDEVDPEQVILFGSRARGDAAADSDVDFVVVEAAPFGKEPRSGAPKRLVFGAHWQDSKSPRTFCSSAATRWNTGAIPSTTSWRAPCAKAKCSMSDIKQARIDSIS